MSRCQVVQDLALNECDDRGRGSTRVFLVPLGISAGLRGSCLAVLNTYDRFRSKAGPKTHTLYLLERFHHEMSTLKPATQIKEKCSNNENDKTWLPGYCIVTRHRTLQGMQRTAIYRCLVLRIVKPDHEKLHF